MVNDWTG
jgi:hypothetical protein